DRRFGRLRIDPHAVLVCARWLVIPEAVALDLTLGAGEGREACVARRFPVVVLEVEPLLGVSLLVVAVENDETALFEGFTFDICHDRGHVLSSGASTF